MGENGIERVASGGVECRGRGKKLLERALDAALEEGLDEAGAKRYVSWRREFILFHNKRHPQEMGMAAR